MVDNPYTKGGITFQRDEEGRLRRIDKPKQVGIAVATPGKKRTGRASKSLTKEQTQAILKEREEAREQQLLAEMQRQRTKSTTSSISSEEGGVSPPDSTFRQQYLQRVEEQRQQEEEVKKPSTREQLIQASQRSEQLNRANQERTRTVDFSNNVLFQTQVDSLVTSNQNQRSNELFKSPTANFNIELKSDLENKNIQFTNLRGQDKFLVKEQIRETKVSKESVDLFKLGFEQKQAPSDLRAVDIRDVYKARDVGSKALSFDTKLTTEELKLLPLAVGRGAFSFAKGAVSVFNPANLEKGVGGLVTSGASVVSGKSTVKKELRATQSGFETALFTNPFETAGAVFSSVVVPSAIKGGRKIYVDKVAPKIDKLNPNKPFFVEKAGKGFEQGKGVIDEFTAVYKGEGFTRAGSKVGVRRTVKPTLEVFKRNPFEFALSVKEKLQGRKPGQIARFDPVGENIAFRDTPSEFAIPSQELSFSNQRIRVSSVTPDSGFLPKDGQFKVISGGGKQLETLSGRAGVGGGELGQFFAPPKLKTTDIISKGQPTANIFYAGLKDYSGSIPTKTVLVKPKAGVLIKTVTPERPSSLSLGKGYIDLAQDLGGYTKPGSTQLSASTLKGIRTEAEVITAPQTITQTRQFSAVTIPGRGKIKLFSGRDIPLTKTQKVEALQANIDFLGGRITQVKQLVKERPSLQAKGQEIIFREQRNILAIEQAKSLLSSSKGKVSSQITSTSPVKTSKIKGSSPIKSISSDSFSIPQTRYVSAIDRVSSKGSIGSISKITDRSSLTIPSGLTIPKKPVLDSSSKVSTSKKPSSNFIPSGIVPKDNTPELSLAEKSIREGQYLGGGSRRSKSGGGSSPKPPSPQPPSPKPPSPIISEVSSSKTSNVFSPGISSIVSSPGVSKKPKTISRGLTPFNFRTTKKKAPSKEFKVEVRRRGEFAPIFITTDKDIAFRTGASEVRGRSSASFRVLEGQSILSPTKSFKGFKASKREKGVLIEESKFRINTPGELAEITLKGIRSDKKKKKKKKVAKSKNPFATPKKKKKSRKNKGFQDITF